MADVYKTWPKDVSGRQLNYLDLTADQRAAIILETISNLSRVMDPAKHFAYGGPRLTHEQLVAVLDRSHRGSGAHRRPEPERSAAIARWETERGGAGREE